ncbi:MAG TPA: IS110 family transposase, partial [Gammaproteobacteria bacterium]|nr:IS110 family transposase [Gammaproteobacteria bacterium]
STGVYWWLVFNILDGQCTALVVNAADIKNVAGRKTDVADSVWIAELLQHGLLRPSFVPDQAQREPRDLTRIRTTLIDGRTAVVNRIRKVLEDANIKPAGVASNIMGVYILAELLAGTTDPVAMADLARGKLRRKKEALAEALRGRMKDRHRLLSALHLKHPDFLEEGIAELSRQIAARLRVQEDELLRLQTIPGIARRAVEVVAAEVGPDMSRFLSAGHLASWAGMCPGNYESAGKHKKGPIRHGNRAMIGRGSSFSARESRQGTCADPAYTSINSITFTLPAPASNVSASALASFSALPCFFQYSLLASLSSFHSSGVLPRFDFSSPWAWRIICACGGASGGTIP